MAEVEQLMGDPSKAMRELGWNPRQTSFEELVRIMVRADMEKVDEEVLVYARTIYYSNTD